MTVADHNTSRQRRSWRDRLRTASDPLNRSSFLLAQQPAPRQPRRKPSSDMADWLVMSTADSKAPAESRESADILDAIVRAETAAPRAPSLPGQEPGSDLPGMESPLDDKQQLSAEDRVSMMQREISRLLEESPAAADPGLPNTPPSAAEAPTAGTAPPASQALAAKVDDLSKQAESLLTSTGKVSQDELDILFGNTTPPAPPPPREKPPAAADVMQSRIQSAEELLPKSGKVSQDELDALFGMTATPPPPAPAAEQPLSAADLTEIRLQSAQTLLPKSGKVSQAELDALFGMAAETPPAPEPAPHAAAPAPAPAAPPAPASPPAAGNLSAELDDAFSAELQSLLGETAQQPPAAASAAASPPAGEMNMSQKILQEQLDELIASTPVKAATPAADDAAVKLTEAEGVLAEELSQLIAETDAPKKAPQSLAAAAAVPLPAPATEAPSVISDETHGDFTAPAATADAPAAAAPAADLTAPANAVLEVEELADLPPAKGILGKTRRFFRNLLVMILQLLDLPFAWISDLDKNIIGVAAFLLLLGGVVLFVMSKFAV